MYDQTANKKCCLRKQHQKIWQPLAIGLGDRILIERPWGKHSLPSLPVKQEHWADGAGKVMRQGRN